MKNTIAIFAGLFLQGSLLCAEDVTLVAMHASNSGGDVPSEIITLNKGDTAKCVYCYSNGPGSPIFRINLDSQLYNVFPSGFGNGLVTIAGPATIQLQANSDSKVVATLSIMRAGLSSPPASIPQEAGTTWDVILESSSDLINWTPTNPGEYSGTEPKRFFRTRIVKKEL